MPACSTAIRYARSVLGKGLMGLGALWLLRALWPMLALAISLLGLIAGMAVGGRRIWRYQQQRYQAQIRYEDRLARQFYALVQRRDGRMSALEFAMHARINRSEAQRYLHELAQAFGAYFERTLNGDIVYTFNLGVIFGMPVANPPAPDVLMPAEMVWAYAEQIQQLRSKQIIPTARGRAQETSGPIKTIDISAMNE